MLFVAAGRTIRILIPPVDGHSYKYGSPSLIPSTDPHLPSTCSGAEALQDLPAGAFQLTGPPASAKHLQDVLSAKQNLLVRHSEFEVIDSKARTIIEAPAPDHARTFRHIELQDADIFGETNPAVAYRKPHTISECICFSWMNAAEVSIGEWYKLTVPANGASLCIYAQGLTDATLQHPTTSNDLMVQPGTGKNPAFNLSRIGKSDGPRDPAEHTGITRCHLLTLSELGKNQVNRHPPSFCGPTFLL
jgi:hypothetical protein